MSSASAGVADVLDFTLDRAAEVPLGVQLAWAIRTRVEDGRLTPGMRLPGLRDVAEALGVNANTVRAVYSRLELEGLVESRQGSGTFVAAAPPRSASASAIATSAAQEALQIGVDPREVAAALYVSATSTESASSLVASSLEASRRRLLRTQIAALEQAIGELESEHPTLLAPTTAPGAKTRRAAPKLPSADELEQVRLGLLRRLATLQAQIDALAEGSAGEARRSASAQRKQARSANGRGTGDAEPAIAGAHGATGASAGKRAARRSSTRPAAAGA
ncbi:MAG TPA: winged helix-turn-helix domain-containing protein [Solirubrobacteraceae bacterium]|jgi:DNA-binding transcriptional regulator YhcF (GntR family)